eukprot:4938997-Prymnesium_polylepis.1
MGGGFVAGPVAWALLCDLKAAYSFSLPGMGVSAPAAGWDDVLDAGAAAASGVATSGGAGAAPRMPWGRLKSAVDTS